MVEVHLVKVEAAALPVFVQAKGEVEMAGWVPVEPVQVGADFRGLAVAVIAVEVDTTPVCAGAELHALGVQEGEEAPVDGRGEGGGLEELEECKGAGGFITMDAGGNVEAGCGASPTLLWGAGEGDDGGRPGRQEAFDVEALGDGELGELGVKGWDVEGFSGVHRCVCGGASDCSP